MNNLIFINIFTFFVYKITEKEFSTQYTISMVFLEIQNLLFKIFFNFVANLPYVQNIISIQTTFV